MASAALLKLINSRRLRPTAQKRPDESQSHMVVDREGLYVSLYDVTQLILPEYLADLLGKLGTTEAEDRLARYLVEEKFGEKYEAEGRWERYKRERPTELALYLAKAADLLEVVKDMLGDA